MEDTRRQNRLSMPNTGRQNRVSMTDTRRHSRLSMFDNPMFDTQRASMYENPQPDSRRASLYENRRASTGAIIGEQNGPRRDFALTRQDSISLGLLDSPSNVDESKKEPVSKEAAPEKNAPASKIPLIILMVAVSLATFLVALVCNFPCWKQYR